MLGGAAARGCSGVTGQSKDGPGRDPGKEAAGSGRRARSRRRRRGHARPVFAAVDLGTNNCRLLIARPEAGGGFKVLDSFSRIVRLGEGLGADGVLCEAAMARTVEALRICAKKMRRWRVAHRRTVATAACRQAANSAAFVARVKRETGILLDVIGAEEEAHLTVQSCAPLFDHSDEMTLVFDIGGGSTELVWIALEPSGTHRLVHWVSLPLGVVTLAEAFGGREVSGETYAAMIGQAAARIAEAKLPAELTEDLKSRRTHMMGTSGTVTILASLHLGLARYERDRVDGLWLTPPQIEAVGAKLRAMSYEARAAHGCIGPERADLVVAGAAIFEAIWRYWPSPRLRVADRGLREGILVTLMADNAARRGMRSAPSARAPAPVPQAVVPVA
jgi:exopolyphosphatase/guanosine-5'-triphosphate,3'-diphosphate pyrophosphatase